MDGISLSVRGLAKSYPGQGASRKTVLDDISLTVPGGAILCLLGDNGAGKTTFLKILAGLVLPDAGDIELAGFNLSHAFGKPMSTTGAVATVDPAADGTRTQGPTGSLNVCKISRAVAQMQQRIGFSPGDERSFYGRLTGLENLKFFAGLRNMRPLNIRQRLLELEEPLGLRELLDVPYLQTSAGMKQRLSLARALLHDPAILLLDEPTKSLDPLSADRARGFLQRTYSGRKDRLILWSSHAIEEAWDTATEIAIMVRGRIVARGTSDHILKTAGAGSPKEAYRALVLRSHDVER